MDVSVHKARQQVQAARWHNLTAVAVVVAHTRDTLTAHRNVRNLHLAREDVYHTRCADEQVSRFVSPGDPN